MKFCKDCKHFKEMKELIGNGVLTVVCVSGHLVTIPLQEG